MDVWATRLLCFLAGLGVYALWGSPTPDNPGLPEIVIGLLFVMAVGFAGAKQALIPSLAGKEALWQSGGKLLLIYGLTMPLLLAGLRGHDPLWVIRDLLPFLFFLLPVFLARNFEQRSGYAPHLLAGIIALGCVFALRSLVHLYPFNILNLVFFVSSEELFYFANAPTVLFSALIFLGLAGRELIKAGGVKQLAGAAGLFVLSLLPLLAMTLSVQRATLGAVLLYVFLLTFLALWKKPGRALRLVILGLVIIWAGLPVIAEMWGVLSQKTSLVGLNMRAQEAAAVWDAVSQDPATMLFGLGWGGSFHSPAVGGLSVNFTHSLVTSMLLKTGLAGLFLAFVYLVGLLNLLSRLLFKHPVLALALAAPVLIDIFLYASFKSLDFGLILLLIPAYQQYLANEFGPQGHA